MALWRPIILCLFLVWPLLLNLVAIAQGDEQTISRSNRQAAPFQPNRGGTGATTLFLPLVAGAAPQTPAQVGARLIPSTVDVPAALEEVVLQILSQATGLPLGIDQFAITDLEPLNEWRFVSVAGLADVPDDLDWNLPDHGHWFGLILVQEQPAGGWSGALEGTGEFSDLLTNASHHLAEPSALAALDPRQGRAQLAEEYILPWEPGTRMQYGGRGVHDNEFSAITPGWKAVDFLSDGNTALGRAPNRILAAASGTITYKCSPRAGENSTAVRVGNLMYTHLVNSASLTVGRTFAQGELLGSLKAGSFSEACGYASQGAAWFHLHWGFPNSGAFSAGGWTLNLADQKWRRGSAAEGIGAWLLAEGIPAPPIPISPGPGETVAEQTVELVWQSPNAPGQDGYSLRISQNANPDSGPWLVDTSLANGQTGYSYTFAADGSFFWHLRTWNLAGQSSTWATQAFTIASAPVCPGSGNSCPPPGPPLLLSPAPDTLFDEGETVELAWQTSVHAEVYRAEISGQSVDSLYFGWTDMVSQTVGAPAPGHTYTWRVRARNLAGESSWSEGRTFTVRPAPPGDLTVQPASCNQVNLLWADHSAAEEGYLIYRDGALIDEVSANTTHYQDGGVLPESRYTYTVTAFAGEVESVAASASTETGACEITPLVVAVAAPDELMVIGGELITTSYTFLATGHHAVQLEHYTMRFTLGDGATPLNDPSGPFDAEILIPAGGTALWEAAIYLPPEVVVAAHSASETRLLLDLLFTGQDELGHSIFVEHRLPLWLETCGDASEPNETLAQATSIATGVVHSGLICPVADRDFYRISGSTGEILVAVVEAASHGSLLDALLELYDSDGEEPLSVVDDSDDSPDPRLIFELPADGEYFVSVRSVSPLVAGADYSYTLHVALDSEPPLATIIQPVTDAWLHTSRQLIEVDAADDETEVERVEFYVMEAGAEAPFWVWLGADADGSNGWQWEWDTSKLPIDQEMEIKAVVYDRAGRSTVVTVAGLRIDRTPPVVVARVEPETEGPGTSCWVVWDDGFDGESGLVSYDVQLREGPDGAWIDWLVGVTETRISFSGEEGRVYFFRARARDQAGNQSEYREGDGDAHFEVPDLTPPSGAFLINDGALYTNNQIVTLTLTVTDVGLGVEQMEIMEGDLFSDTQWISSTPTTTWVLSSEEGAKTLSVRWRDRAGNVSTGITQSITLDTIAPTGGLTVAGGSLTPEGEVLLQITVDEEWAGVQMRLRTNDGEWSDWMPAVESLYWSLGEGATLITLQFRDQAGNLSALYEAALGATAPANQAFLPLVQLGETLAPDDEVPPH